MALTSTRRTISASVMNWRTSKLRSIRKNSKHKLTIYLCIYIHIYRIFTAWIFAVHYWYLCETALIHVLCCFYKLLKTIFTSKCYQICRNPYLSRAYGGTWFRANFQDLFSYRGAQKLEWFEVLEGNDCSPVPATLNAGRPPRDICNEAAVEERRCICINTG